MQSLVADFVQFSSAFAKYFVLEGRLNTTRAKTLKSFKGFVVACDIKNQAERIDLY